MMSTVVSLYKKYVRGTDRKAIVQMVIVLLCHLTAAVAKGVGTECTKVYINSRVVKHIYDKRPAQEFDFLISQAEHIVKYPDYIYKNKSGKRGSFCFVKKVNNELWIVSIEIIQQKEIESHCEVVTFFRTNPEYLESFELLWKWEVGIPPS